MQQHDSFSFNGNQFRIEDVSDIDTGGGTTGVSYSGALVTGKYTAYIRIQFKDSTPEEVWSVDGSSVAGIGNRGSAIKEYKRACEDLYQVLGDYIVKEKAQKVSDGTPITIGSVAIPNHAENWALHPDSVIYHRVFKERVIRRGELTRCVFKDPMFHLYTSDGKHLKQPATDDHFKNLCIPGIMALLYQQS